MEGSHRVTVQQTIASESSELHQLKHEVQMKPICCMSCAAVMLDSMNNLYQTSSSMALYIVGFSQHSGPVCSARVILHCVTSLHVLANSV